uniref:Uncharacterized protein n=1 Tax=Anopheles epiroticus TaxID=199890 RepID=A0A182PYF8_9DIPT
MRRQHLLADGLLRQRQPELARLQRGFVWVLRTYQHVLYDAVHVRHQPIHAHVQQHYQPAAHVLPHLPIVVRRQVEQALDERVDVHHQGLSAVDNELINASDRVRPDFGTRVAEKLQELRDHDVERTVQRTAVERVGGIFANFL